MQEIDFGIITLNVDHKIIKRKFFFDNCNSPPKRKNEAATPF